MYAYLLLEQHVATTAPLEPYPLSLDEHHQDHGGGANHVLDLWNAHEDAQSESSTLAVHSELDSA